MQRLVDPRRLDRLLVALTGAVAALYVLLSGMALPEAVAVHFGSGGAAEGYMGRSMYLGVMVVLAAGLPLSLWWMQRPHRRSVPPPPARSTDAAIRFLRWHAAAFTVGLCLFLCRVHALVLAANDDGLVEPRFDLSGLLGAALVFGVFVLAWVLVRVRRLGT